MKIIGNIKKVLCDKEDLVFLCIGCPKYPLDSFAPRLGSKLKEAGFTVYGTVEKPIDGKNYIEECLKVMFENEDKKIVAIDSGIGSKKNLGNIKLRPNRGIEPASATNFFTIEVGNSSILGVTSCDIKDVIKKRKTSSVNIDDMVEKIYNEIINFFK